MKNITLLLAVFSMNMASGMSFKKLAEATEQAKAPVMVVAPTITGASLEFMAQKSIFSVTSSGSSQTLESDQRVGLNPNDKMYQMYHSMFKTGDIASLEAAAQKLKADIDKSPLAVHTYDYKQLETVEDFLRQMPNDKTYLYRTINLDNPASKRFLIDQKMQEYHRMYLKGEISALELEKKRNELEYRNTGWLDFHSQRILKRRLSFIRRILTFTEQIKKDPSYGLQKGRHTPIGFSKRGFSYDAPLIINRADVSVTIAPLLPSDQIIPLTSSSPNLVSQSQKSPAAAQAPQPILEHMIISDLKHPLHATYDSLLAMVQIENPEMFGEYKAALDSILNSIDYTKLDEGNFDSYTQAMKYAFRQYFHHVQPTNPLKHPKEFLINTAKYVGWWVFNVSCGNKLLVLEKAGLICSRIYELSSDDYSQMTAKERIDMIAQHAADITWGIATNKALQKIPFSKTFARRVGELNSSIPKSSSSSSSSGMNTAHSVENPQAVTPEGLVIDAKNANSSSSASERSKNNKTGGGSSNLPPKVILKVDNMEQFFETSFGKEIKDSVQKMRGNTPVYVVTEKVRKFDYVLKKGDQIYLDNLHKDHLEVFSGNNDFKMVLNLDGTKNIDKTVKGFGRRL